MHRLWSQEKQWFRKNVFPDVSTTENLAKAGQYTTIVWRTSTLVGYAAAH